MQEPVLHPTPPLQYHHQAVIKQCPTSTWTPSGTYPYTYKQLVPNFPDAVLEAAGGARQRYSYRLYAADGTVLRLANCVMPDTERARVLLRRALQFEPTGVYRATPVPASRTYEATCARGDRFCFEEKIKETGQTPDTGYLIDGMPAPGDAPADQGPTDVTTNSCDPPDPGDDDPVPPYEEPDWPEPPPSEGGDGGDDDDNNDNDDDGGDGDEPHDPSEPPPIIAAIDDCGGAGSGGSGGGSSDPGDPPCIDCGDGGTAPSLSDLLNGSPAPSYAPSGVASSFYNTLNRAEKLVCWAGPGQCIGAAASAGIARMFAQQEYPNMGSVNTPRDAFRHARWAAEMIAWIGGPWAVLWQEAHEYESTDPLPTAMGRHNNGIGNDIGWQYPYSDFANEIRRARDDGRLQMWVCPAIESANPNDCR